MKCLEDPSPNLGDMNKEVKALLSDPMILVETEADLNEVVRDFSGSPEMIAFKNKYQKLDQLLRDTMEDEGKLAKKSTEINGEMVVNNSKIHTALKLTQEYK